MSDDEEMAQTSREETPAAPAPTLKIKLKLNQTHKPKQSPNKRQPARRAATKRKRAETEDEIESEDEDSAGGEFNPDGEDELDEESSRAPSRAPAKLTARQAAKAGAGGAEQHVALNMDAPTTKRGRKATLTEAELQMRREETARKRKNLSEKKLEDEKQETINRLLRKQGRRGAKDVDEDEEDEDAEGEEQEVPEPAGPTIPMFRWVSSAKGITFSVPEAWLPPASKEATAEPVSAA